MQIKGRFTLCTISEFDDWLNGTSISRSITVVQNHHTWSPDYAAFRENHFEMLSRMEHYHIRERGFDMIAQNLTTFPDGQLAICRPLDRIPAGIKGANQHGICIEHLGNFDTGGDMMTDSHRETIIRVNAILCRKFNLIPSTDSIVYHHWYDLDSARRSDGAGNTKSCPGSAFFGGNSVSAAASGFVPLVRQSLDYWQYVEPPRPPLTTAEVVVDTLNVRNGAGMSYAVLKQVRRGVTVQVFETTGGWCRIAPQAQEWVCGRYLQ